MYKEEKLRKKIIVIQKKKILINNNFLIKLEIIIKKFKKKKNHYSSSSSLSSTSYKLSPHISSISLSPLVYYRNNYCFVPPSSGDFFNDSISSSLTILTCSVFLGEFLFENKIFKSFNYKSIKEFFSVEISNWQSKKSKII